MRQLFGFALGLGFGVLSAWGVGGGTVLLLAMTLLMGVDQSAAQTVNLLYFLPTGAVALLFHRRRGLVCRDVCRLLRPAAMAAALGASLLARRLDARALRRPFGLLLIYIALSTLWRQKKTAVG